MDLIDFKWLIYRIFETKWKRACWNVAEKHLQLANEALNTKHGMKAIRDFDYHFNKANKAMELIF